MPKRRESTGALEAARAQPPLQSCPSGSAERNSRLNISVSYGIENNEVQQSGELNTERCCNSSCEEV